MILRRKLDDHLHALGVIGDLPINLPDELLLELIPLALPHCALPAEERLPPDPCQGNGGLDVPRTPDMLAEFEDQPLVEERWARHVIVLAPRRPRVSPLESLPRPDA